MLTVATEAPTPMVVAMLNPRTMACEDISRVAFTLSDEAVTSTPSARA